MKIRFTFALVGLLSLNINAQEQLHTFPSSGLQLYATNNVKKVQAEGSNVRFFLENNEILATAFIYKDAKNPYPLIKDFSKQFLHKIHANNDINIFKMNQIKSNFLNKKIDSIEYLIEVDKAKCELYLVSAVGNQTYIFFNISNEVTNYKCESQSDKLKSFGKQVTESIAINDI